MNILIAPDSFKESLPAIEVGQAIKYGFSQIYPEANYTLLPLADGGEGTCEVVSHLLEGQWCSVSVHDPLMRPISAKYFLTKSGTAIIEIAETCGLHLLSHQERNPLITTSYGVGEMLIDAIEQGATNILIGLGGSATNDAGAGMLQALGVKFTDPEGIELGPGGANLSQLTGINLSSNGMSAAQTLATPQTTQIKTTLINPHSKSAPNSQLKPFINKLSGINITVACDVTSPLCGPTGASHIFGPQKGATPEQVEVLDKALAHFAAITNQYGINNQDCSQFQGSGAAGGLGFALMSYFGAELRSGFDTIAAMACLDEHLAEADLVITGEGKLDSQTAMGKVANGVAIQAKKHKVPVIAICGSVERSTNTQTDLELSSIVNSPFDIVLPSIQKIDKLETILANAYPNVVQTAYQLAATLKLGQGFSHK